MEIEGQGIIIKTIELKDAYHISSWGRHENPLLSDYNLPPVSNEEIEEWYRLKTNNRRRIYYSIFDKHHKFIGYMGIKNIRKILGWATLGIALDPNHVGQGYGTKAITTYLKYFFDEMSMNVLFLEVAKFNKRAIKCYKKSGFRIIDLYLEEFFNQSLDLNNPYFLEEKSSFVIEDGRIYNYIYKMKIDKKMYSNTGKRHD